MDNTALLYLQVKQAEAEDNLVQANDAAILYNLLIDAIDEARGNE